MLDGRRADGARDTKYTLLPLDDCLYAMQATIPHLTRSSLHRCLQLPAARNRRRKASKKKFKTYPIGLFHIDIAEVRTEEGRLYLFVAIDRTSKLAFAKLRLAGVIQVTTQRDYTPSSIGAAFHTFNLTIKLRFARL
jgi:hypothetical protein